MFLDSTDAAWLAAAIDGEGSIILQPHRRRDDRYTIDRIVQIVNTNLAFVRRAQEITGLGYIVQHVSGKVGTNLVPMFAWKVTNGDGITAVLNAILPYLIIKRRQAELMFDYISRRTISLHHKRGKPRGTLNYTTGELAIAEQVRLLNRRRSGTVRRLGLLTSLSRISATSRTYEGALLPSS